MSESTKAVFLSYASQDAEAARHIAESLRASGVEVWFDVEGGLEHGDEWDAKIRRQIKECVLFIPLISKNTQSRLEGYFRIEWELAAQRAMGIASGVAFILPVVIDDTREPDALVPDRFRAVQWTRLPAGVVSPDVQARFRKLWSHRTGVLKHAAESGGQTTEDRGRRTEDRADPSQSRKRNPAVIAFAILALAAVAAIVVWRPWQRSDSEQPAHPELARGERAESAERATVPTTEARQLVERARELMGKVNVLPADLSTAAGMLEQAAKLEPNDALVWSTWTLLDLRYVALDYDNTPSRHNAARTHAARANALDPASRETRYVQASMMRNLSYDPDTLAAAEQILRPMLTEAPNDGRVLIQLGWVAHARGQRDEAIGLWDRAARMPVVAPDAAYSKALALVLANQFDASYHAYDEFLALEPNSAQGLTGKGYLSAAWRGDLDEAQDLINRIPPQMRVEDMSAFFGYTVSMFRREYDQAVQAIRAVPRDYLSAQPGPGPSGFYVGDALAAAGRTAAAAIEWRSALTVVERRLEETPRNRTLMEFKALLLARLGDHAAGEQTWKAVVELYGDNAWGYLAPYLHVEFLPPDEAIAWLSDRLTSPQYWFTAASLRLNPVYDRVRSNPKFTALVEKMEADPRFSPKAKQRTDNGGPRTEDGSQWTDSDLPATRSSPALSQSNGLLATAPDKSVAVLAFANLSDDKSNEYFSDGISEELLNVLAKVPGLKVTARTSAFFFKDKHVPIADIARQLGVAYVVEGSVRKAGDRVRISAQLIKASDGFQVWSDSFDREIKDIFAVQDEIAGLIASNLSLRMGVNSSASKTINPAAFQFYLQGRQAWRTRTKAGFEEAERLFNQALAIDAKFARAYVGLADVWLIQSDTETVVGAFDQRESPSWSRIEAAVLKALELNPDLAEAHATLGSVRWMQWRFEDGIRELRRAVTLNPSYISGHQWLGRVYLSTGQMDEALEQLKLAHELDPLYARVADNYAQALIAAQRSQEALAALDQALAVQPDSNQALRMKAVALVELGRNDEAITAARLYLDRGADAGINFVAYVLARASARTEAARILANTDSSEADPPWLAAALALDNTDVFNQDIPVGGIKVQPLELLYFWPVFDTVRDKPAFVQMLKTLGITGANARAQAWRAAHPPEKSEVKP